MLLYLNFKLKGTMDNDVHSVLENAFYPANLVRIISFFNSLLQSNVILYSNIFHTKFIVTKKLILKRYVVPLKK